MRIMITGATGFIGSHLVRALLEQGHDIIVCVRRPENAKKQWPEITALEADFSTEHKRSNWLPRLKKVDVVINAIGIIRETGNQTFDALHTRAPVALFRACESTEVKRVIQISALGADENAFSHYHRSKREADQVLRNSRLDWAIIMPSIVYGPGAKSMALFKAISALPLIPLIDRGDQPIQPIHIDDMTRAVVELVESASPLGYDIEMVGPAPVTMKELYAKLRHWLGLGQARFCSIPYRLSLLWARFAGLLGQTPITKEAVQMLRRGNTGNVEAFVARFGFKPIGIENSLKKTPAQQPDRWHAGLYFLAPTLRLAIAFVWLLTGFVSVFVFPVEQSYAMLARVGIEGIWQPIMLYAAAATDILLGITTLLSFHLRLTVLLQISIILLYSIIISLWLPEQWIHPFGPMSKNLPLLVATVIMLVLERRK
jgi:uncharacterized protein YbjT (DUF2867 family)